MGKGGKQMADYPDILKRAFGCKREERKCIRNQMMTTTESHMGTADTETFY